MNSPVLDNRNWLGIFASGATLITRRANFPNKCGNCVGGMTRARNAEGRVAAIILPSFPKSLRPEPSLKASYFS